MYTFTYFWHVFTTLLPKREIFPYSGPKIGGFRATGPPKCFASTLKMLYKEKDTILKPIKCVSHSFFLSNEKILMLFDDIWFLGPFFTPFWPISGIYTAVYSIGTTSCNDSNILLTWWIFFVWYDHFLQSYCLKYTFAHSRVNLGAGDFYPKYPFIFKKRYWLWWPDSCSLKRKRM